MMQPAVDPFESSLTGPPAIVVSLSRIVDPLGRRPHDVPRIEMYRRDMLAGARFPPISVVKWGSRYLVADGHKRLAAYAALQRPDVRVELWTWGRWARDQGRQVRDNAAKNARILRLSVTDPMAALRLAGSTLAHWRRVASCLTPARATPYTFPTMKRSSHQWNVRVRQALLTAVLGLPLVAAIATAPPFAAAPRAQSGSHMLGPAAPILAGPGVVPTRSGNAITIPSQWACGSSTNNVLTLSNPDSSGRFRTISRTVGLTQQVITITAVLNGAPQVFTITESIGGVQGSSTTVTLTDQNSDGVPDGATLTGTINATTSFVYLSNGAYVSIPWSQASALGIDVTNTCAGFVPQVWIPLADTNNDGRGDSIVLDLDGNGVADADLFAGPALALPSVPASGPVARLVLMLLMGLIGAWFLSRRWNHSAGTPA